MYTDIFFDLDHTLWDFEKNSRETLSELFYEFGLNDIMDIPLDDFIKHYEQENKLLWVAHLKGEISREFALPIALVQDTLRYDIFIYDRSLNQSNTITTSTVILNTR